MYRDLVVFFNSLPCTVLFLLRENPVTNQGVFALICRNIHLWFRELVNSYGTLATIICSFLNGREGGELYIGVRKSGEILGIALTRKRRDDVRQVLDRVVSQMIEPRLPTMLVEGRPLVVSKH